MDSNLETVMGSMLKPPPFLAFLFFTSALFAETGTVMGITGTWKLGNRAVRFGSEVARDATLACTPAATLMLAIGTGGASAHLFGRCGEHDRLNLKTLEQKQESSGWLEKFVKAVKTRPQHTEGLIAAVSRDPSRTLVDAVVPLRDGHVDLADALRGVSPGTWHLRLAPIAGGGKPFDVDVTKSAGKPASVPADTLRPGLYSLTLVDEQPISEAWVLISSPPDYSTVSAQYQQATAAALVTWEQLGTSGVQPMLRAYLESLAGGAR
jgi:hypothetical protein